MTTTRPWPTPGPDARDLIIRDARTMVRLKWRALFGPRQVEAMARIRKHEIATATNEALAAVMARRNARAEG